MARVKQLSPMGSSTLHPDGVLEIRTDQGMEAMIKGFDFWMPDEDAPDFAAVEVAEANPQLIALYRQHGRIPAEVRGQIWEISVPFRNADDGHTFCVFVEKPSKPTRDEAMWMAYRAHYAEREKLNDPDQRPGESPKTL